MDSRTAAHALARVAELVELQGDNRFKARAYATAAKVVLAMNVDDIRPLLDSGELAATAGLGPATLSVLEDLARHGRSRYQEQLEAETPEGLVEMLQIPGLGTAKIRAIHEKLRIASLAELERAAQDGRLATVKGFGAKTVERLLGSIAFLREHAAQVLYPRARVQAELLADAVRALPGVTRAEIAGEVRRRLETVGDIDLVASCSDDPVRVAAQVAGGPGVREAKGVGSARVEVRYVDGTRLDLVCARSEAWALAWWRATGSAEHVRDLRAHAESKGFALDDDALRDPAGAVVPLADEAGLYAALGLAWVPPELREGQGEIEAARAGALPTLVTRQDLRGVLHCHSTWSDGKATIAEMAEAAMARGWSYLGITDHSQAAFYAGGMKPDQVRLQHEEIDALNAQYAGRLTLLKGIEADILADGRVDYDERTLDLFDFVVASVHSRFNMEEAAMTERVLAAIADPHVTILAHPTGRLLLSRAAYAIDMHAVIARAGELGVSVELNADPHRLDLDWRLLREATAAGVLVEIGPDAHSTQGLDNVDIGVGIARKGWLAAADVLNTRGVDEVRAFARARREGRAGRATSAGRTR